MSTIKSILSNEKYKGDALLMKTYTVDYLTKEKRKNEGDVRQFLVENSHEPIIEPEIFDCVQKKLQKHCMNRAKIKSDHPFANRLICGDCGEFYGHKVWHNRKNTNRYDIWYCNHKYNQPKRCQTPFLREDEIHTAFEKALAGIGSNEASFSEERWRTLVESVTVNPDRSMKFLFTDGTETTLAP